MEQASTAILKNEVSSADAKRYLCFSLGKEKFAIPLLQVKEVIAFVEPTPIPQAPAYFRGIFNLRGNVISLLDLRSKIKVGKPDITTETTIIILDINSTLLGVVVDSVNSVTKFESVDLSAAPKTDSATKVDFISGVAKANNTLTLILNLELVLNVGDLNIIKNSTQKTQAA